MNFEHNQVSVKEDRVGEAKYIGEEEELQKDRSCGQKKETKEEESKIKHNV